MNIFKQIIVASLGLFFLAASAQSAEQPVLVVYKTDPWLIVIGSDSPHYVYYPNGDFIFWQMSDHNSGEYRIVNIAGTPEAQKLLSLTVGTKKRDEVIVLSNWTDQPTIRFHISTKAQSHIVSVYGNLDSENDEKPPEDVMALWAFLSSQKWVDAMPWQSEYIEVMVRPYPGAPEDSTAWPSGWPDLTSPTTIERQSGSYSIYLPGSEKDAFSEFKKSQVQNGAVLINGKKMAVSFRIPFPHEQNYPAKL